MYILFFVSLLVLVSIEDMKTRTIPNYYPLAILVLSLLTSSVGQVLIDSLMIGGLFLMIALLSNGKLGGGDVKLMAALGAYLGVIGAVVSIIVGLVIAIITEILVRRNLKDSFALGPYLAAGAALVPLINMMTGI